MSGQDMIQTSCKRKKLTGRMFRREQDLQPSMTTTITWHASLALPPGY